LKHKFKVLGAVITIALGASYQACPKGLSDVIDGVDIDLDVEKDRDAGQE